MTSAFENYMKPSESENIEPAKEIELTEVDRNDIETKAKVIVCDNFNKTFFPGEDSVKVQPKDFYVVIKSKVLQNWKALVSTDVISGQYWEVTYDGGKSQSYVDHYVKRTNTCVTDEAYAALP